MNAEQRTAAERRCLGRARAALPGTRTLLCAHSVPFPPATAAAVLTLSYLSTAACTTSPKRSSVTARATAALPAQAASGAVPAPESLHTYLSLSSHPFLYNVHVLTFKYRSYFTGIENDVEEPRIHSTCCRTALWVPVSVQNPDRKTKPSATAINPVASHVPAGATEHRLYLFNQANNSGLLSKRSCGIPHNKPFFLVIGYALAALDIPALYRAPLPTSDFSPTLESTGRKTRPSVPAGFSSTLDKSISPARMRNKKNVANA
ncbi:uncharacterized protein LOC114010646 [Falco peregrinus]|uniref:uncharacterized protein LOC114010646 n=1 Tax=Falco peregrinus TaxID=8954 RepID=UPI00247B1D61|nr:uncharacterized protein LOC114010646 [Falco peregrinus]